MPSAMSSASPPQEHRTCRYCRSYTPHNNKVMYAPDGREVHAGQRLSMPGRQLFLYEWRTIGKLLQRRP